MSDQRRRDAEYTKDRIGWLDQVAADPKLPASAFKVAFAIATSLWRTKGTVTLVTPETATSDQVREAWIGTRAIADNIAMSRFTVMKAVEQLRERGHLEVKYGQRGRGHSNHYRLVKRCADAPFGDDKETRKGAHSSLLDGEQAEPKAKRKGAPKNPLDAEKVRPRTSRGAPTHLNPFVPSESPSEEERGAPQARPRRAPSDDDGSAVDHVALDATETGPALEAQAYMGSCPISTDEDFDFEAILADQQRDMEGV
jgi:biotin operon repressor